MRVPLSWLAEFVDIELAPEALAERLTLLGMEVRSVERRGAEWRNVVVGELLTVARHPRADRLSLTTVTTGSGAPLEIVCGATNIAPGQRVPVALPGAVLPGNRRIERTEKMGVVSNGMLCSGDELQLTGDGEGILILPADTPLGVPLADLFGDVVLDVDVKPNRGDALSIVGLAREVAAITGTGLRQPLLDVVESGAPVGDRLAVTVHDAVLCPRFVGRWVGGVRVGPSPDAIQMRLLAAGVRPISNVVDASNYVMLELGKPIHTFDAGAVEGGRLVVRLARAGERLQTLDHVERDLDQDTLLIADARGPLAIAGVMGGAASEVSDATIDVIVESAIFDPVSIRRTAFRYALRSEASLRFEKGQETRLARLGADRAARLLADWAGGTVAPGRVDTAPQEPDPARVAFRPARAGRLLGLALGVDEQAALLRRVGIEVEVPAPDVPTVAIPVAAGTKPLSAACPAVDALVALVPTWRRDLLVEADIIEELARVNGYDRIPTTLPATPMPPFRPTPLAVRDHVRGTLAGLAPAAAGETPGEGDPIWVTNPLSADHALLRQNLVGGLVEVIVANRRRGREDAAIFEVGKGYGRLADDAREWWRLGIALAGAFDPPAWNRERRAADLDDMKGIVEALAGALGLPRPRFATLATEPMLHPGRAATVLVGGDADGPALSGAIGEVHPALAGEWDERSRGALVAELSIRGLAAGSLPVPRGLTPARHPEVDRDIAIVVTAERPAGEIEAVIRDHAGPLLRDVRLFDVYRGVPLAASERSLAFRLTFGDPDRTLNEAEVETAMAAVTSAATAAGGRIRS
ncbi:MAG: phenylalanine--tRNA ligase subunit beta [Chloroflexi bacterium]|nr:phenylalanine--tRNA ligase subunit beta [Chloroflexota bacterium]